MKFKMKEKGFKKTFEKFQLQKQKAKNFVKNLKIKNVAKTAKKGNVLSIMLGATKSATADQPNFPKGSKHYRDPKKSMF